MRICGGSRFRAGLRPAGRKQLVPQYKSARGEGRTHNKTCTNRFETQDPSHIMRWSPKATGPPTPKWRSNTGKLPPGRRPLAAEARTNASTRQGAGIRANLHDQSTRSRNPLTKHEHDQQHHRQVHRHVMIAIGLRGKCVVSGVASGETTSLRRTPEFLPSDPAVPKLPFFRMSPPRLAPPAGPRFAGQVDGHMRA